MRWLINKIKNMNLCEQQLLKTAGTVVTNGFVGIYKLFLGIYYMSDWLAVNALYYIALTITKGQILKKYAKIKQTVEEDMCRMQEKELLWKTGRFECMLGVSYFCVSLHTLLAGDTVSYLDYIRYVMIVIAFGKILSAIYGLFQTKKIHDPVIAAIRIVDFTDAVVSVVVCRSVIQVMEGAEFAVESSGILGIVSSILFAVTGIVMVRWGRH